MELFRSVCCICLLPFLLDVVEQQLCMRCQAPESFQLGCSAVTNPPQPSAYPLSLSISVCGGGGGVTNLIICQDGEMGGAGLCSVDLCRLCRIMHYFSCLYFPQQAFTAILGGPYSPSSCSTAPQKLAATLSLFPQSAKAASILHCTTPRIPALHDPALQCKVAHG